MKNWTREQHQESTNKPELSTDERLKIIANLIIDRILEQRKQLNIIDKQQ